MNILEQLTAWKHMHQFCQRTPGVHLVGGGTGSGKTMAAAAMASDLQAKGVMVASFPEVEIRCEADWQQAVSQARAGATVLRTIHASNIASMKDRFNQLGIPESDLSWVRSVTVVQLVGREQPQADVDTAHTLLSEFALFHEVEGARGLWDPLLTMRQDAILKILNREISSDALDANLRPRPKPMKQGSMHDLMKEFGH